MNITTNYPNVSLVTTNPATDSVVRESAVRPIVPATEALTQGNAEPPVAGERDKAQPAPISPSLNPTYDLTNPSLPEKTDSTNQERDASEQDPNGQEQSAQGEEQQGEQRGREEQEEGKRNSAQPNERYTEEEQQQIEQLKRRDSEVVAHEQAHAAVGGKYAGSPSYSFQTGPDGNKYAVGGEVSIDTSKIPNDPQATLLKAQQIRRAALAPASPSGQDRRVAAQATQMASEARQDILADQRQASEERPSYRINNEVESDSFNRRISQAQDPAFQQTIKNRTQHINAYYNQASQALEPAQLQQQV
ncbi:putative metalloprotease CJM1_0395 family protein [Psychrobium sp. 1_MG-2023]|uniref:putative metalloprotease CJM1_0395 family protein n=1 Tax=Psychrobium sp. 1_MG-2023 TaxID=3062624 RepID=UPI000C31FE55|nr:putative metalloprotease CJM1_0395 family protein [Psychrobium sp. 1_MG-2023]MDP2561958.1 putative metalloprotease CJM1_0395 family protein [Psychrobium sp. 1_MG-2023]PKF58660.1 catalase [Alteromonadales bacterium alter-6D02]